MLALILVSDYIERWGGGGGEAARNVEITKVLLRGGGGGGGEGGGAVRNVGTTEVPAHVRPLIISPDPSFCPVVKRNFI